MPGVTEEQIIAARRMTAIEFLRQYRLQYLLTQLPLIAFVAL